MATYPPQQQQQAPPPGGHPQHGQPPGGGAAVPDSYFTESRKGEINELRNLLRGFGTERDPQRKRDIIKKVIAYMTVGIDVSRLFSEMMLAIETRDLVIKKMVYLYLTNYARTHPELAQMCTNTLQKDCSNEDPMVRGLALRALCGLNLPSMIEYISEPLRRSLSDMHPYVRKTGVMGLLKLYHLDRAAFAEDSEGGSGFTDLLYDMLKDPDASVVCNCIIVLNEIMKDSPAGGMAINRAIMLHLLNRLPEFDEFSKVQVLELVPRYIPANEDEGYQIMNLLDPVLSTSSPAAVMATIRAFLSLSESLGGGVSDDGGPDSMKRQIIGRVKAPLVTQISSGSSEHMYTLLKHVDALCDISPGVFDDEYRQFFVRYNEPTYVKYLKVGILAKLSNPDTAPDIVAELAECCGGQGGGSTNNVKLARLSIQAMSRIGCSDRGGPGAAEAIARRLVEMLEWNHMDHVSSEAAVALTQMMRKHATLKQLIAPPLVRALRYSSSQGDPTGKAAIIWLIGECGDAVTQAPYAIEKLIDQYDELTDAQVKNALLITTMKLFFQRPPEVIHMLGRLLGKACDDVTSQDLHDRALLYYRMLRGGTANLESLRHVVLTETNIAPTIKFTEDNDTDELRRTSLMEEFNTLSTIYGKTSVNFIAPEFQVKYVKMPKEHPLTGPTPAAGAAAGGAVPDTATNLLDPGATSASAAAAPAPPQAAAAGEMDLLGFGGPASPTAAPDAAPAGGLQLSAGFTLSGDDYQTKWGAINDADAIVSAIPLNTMPGSTDEVERALSQKCHVMTMASGDLPTEYKFFLYGQNASQPDQLFLIQANIDKQQVADPMIIVTVKVAGGSDAASNNAQGQALVDRMTTALN